MVPTVVTFIRAMEIHPEDTYIRNMEHTTIAQTLQQSLAQRTTPPRRAT
jgi:hypothetical protein